MLTFTTERDAIMAVSVVFCVLWKLLRVKEDSEMNEGYMMDVEGRITTSFRSFKVVMEVVDRWNDVCWKFRLGMIGSCWSQLLSEDRMKVICRRWMVVL